MLYCSTQKLWNEVLRGSRTILFGLVEGSRCRALDSSVAARLVRGNRDHRRLCSVIPQISCEPSRSSGRFGGVQVLGLFGVRHKPGRPFLFGKRGLVVGIYIYLFEKVVYASGGKDLDFG
jgi:hypothetical protein